MKTIHKYVLDGPRTNIHTTEGTRFLHVANQHNQVTIWAEVHTLTRDTTRVLHAVPTGGEVPVGVDYLGTALLNDGRLVIHVYADRESR